MVNNNSKAGDPLSVPAGLSPAIPYDLVVTLALTSAHTISSTAMVILPAIAPAVARDYGIDASLIGYQIGIMGTGLLTSLLLFGNLSRRMGGCRTHQLGQGLLAFGLLSMLFPFVALLIPGSFLMGCAFGLLGPANSTLLARFAPAERRNMVFSIQQTSVPLGGVIAGLIGPVIAVTVGWRWALALIAIVLLIVIALLQRVRARWDAERHPGAPMVASNPFAGIVTNWRDRRLRLLSVSGGAFCWAQFCVAGYTVVACVEALGMDLIAAGGVLIVVNLVTAAGRVIAGGLADWLKSAARVLLWTGWIMLATCIAMLWLSPAWNTLLVYVAFSLLGITSCAWSGLVLAEVGHLAPKGHVALVTAGTLAYVNTGKLVGPMVFAVTYTITRSYGIAFACVGIPAIVAIYCMMAVQRVRNP